MNEEIDKYSKEYQEFYKSYWDKGYRDFYKFFVVMLICLPITIILGLMIANFLEIIF